MNRQPPGERLTEYTGEYDAFFDALKAGKARLALVFGRRPGVKEELPQAYDYAERMRQRVPGLSVMDATAVVWGLRQVKTPYERGGAAAQHRHLGDAHRAAMRATKPEPLRVRGGGGAREGLPRARRAELGLSLDRRQRAERHDPALQPLARGR